ncbi:MAG TPA: ABC transporter permease [Thermomonospora sp.]|nr:ABC transporter permease [Thermomonospora sp.]
MWFTGERRGGRRWIVPVLTLAAGVGVAAVLAARDRTGTGLAALAVLAGYAAHLGYRRDEPALPVSAAFGSGHRARAHLRSAAVTGDVLVAALVAAVVVEALRGGDVAPYAWLAALAGGVYALSAMVTGRGM